MSRAWPGHSYQTSRYLTRRLCKSLGTVSYSPSIVSCIISEILVATRKSWIFHPPLAFDAPMKGVPIRILPYRLVCKNQNNVANQRHKKSEDMSNRFDRIPLCDGRTEGWTDILWQHSLFYSVTEANTSFFFSYLMCDRRKFNVDDRLFPKFSPVTQNDGLKVSKTYWSRLLIIICIR